MIITARGARWLRGRSMTNVDPCAPTPPAPAPWTPRGISIFLDSKAQSKRQPGTLAKNVVESGGKGASVWGWAQDGRRASVENVVSHVSALTDLGLEPSVWFFPSPSRVDDCVRHADAIRTALPKVRFIADWEGHTREKWTERAVSTFLQIEPDAVTAVPSYVSHPLFPMWDGVRTRLVQVERSGDNVPLIETTMRRWTDDGYVTEAVAGAFMGDHERLRGDCRRLLFDPSGRGPRHQGIFVYSATTIDGRDRAVLRDVAGWF
jgi:hypothetical protein